MGGKKKSHVTQDPFPHVLQKATGGSSGCCGQPRAVVLVAGPWKVETDGVETEGVAAAAAALG